MAYSSSKLIDLHDSFLLSSAIPTVRVCVFKISLQHYNYIKWFYIIVNCSQFLSDLAFGNPL